LGIIVVTVLWVGISSYKSNQISPDFETDARYAYNLLVAAGDGTHIRQYDFDLAMAKASSTAKTDADKWALHLLTDLSFLYKRLDLESNDPLDKTAWNNCKGQFEQSVGMRSKGQEYKCTDLKNLSIERFTAQVGCSGNKDQRTCLAKVNADFDAKMKALKVPD
jgi:hypothetical protein